MISVDPEPHLSVSNENCSSSSPENSDDFVLVPKNLPSADQGAVNYERKYVFFFLF